LDDTQIKQIILEKIRITTPQHINRDIWQDATVDVVNDLTDHIIVHVTHNLLGKKEHGTITTNWVHCPQNWWDMLFVSLSEKKYMPLWIKERLQRYAKYSSIPVKLETTRVCPHIEVPPNHPKHLGFLAEKS
tara:strand:+ start:71 stop:466 length:396 start_codon:yes stop_codon:yes gene_type:complete